MTEDSKGNFWFPQGHFYSPIPSIEEVRLKEETIFNNISIKLPGIDLNVKGQFKLLRKLKKYYKDLPYSSGKRNSLRFNLDNPNYSYSDAIFLYCMIRHLRPKKIIEVGSGYSSCIILDTNELYFNNRIFSTFIDPFPQLLSSLIKDTDNKKIEVIEKNIQDVDLEKFSELSASDILFIDSTHVSKVHSDVNYIFFEILPLLKPGVFIHFHDIFYPFEYPKEWIYQGLAWNEAYLLRAFLQYNNAFKIQLFNTYLGQFYFDKFFDEIPIPLKYIGASIWIKKVKCLSRYW